MQTVTKVNFLYGYVPTSTISKLADPIPKVSNAGGAGEKLARKSTIKPQKKEGSGKDSRV